MKKNLLEADMTKFNISSNLKVWAMKSLQVSLLILLGTSFVYSAAVTEETFRSRSQSKDNKTLTRNELRKHTKNFKKDLAAGITESKSGKILTNNPNVESRKAQAKRYAGKLNPFKQSRAPSS